MGGAGAVSSPASVRTRTGRAANFVLNGSPPAAEFPPEVAVRPEKIDAILGEQKVTGVQLSGGDVVELVHIADFLLLQFIFKPLFIIAAEF